MDNICENVLKLEGDEEEINRFVQLTIQTDDDVYDLEHETVLNFNKLSPISAEDVSGSEKGILETVEGDYDEATRSYKFTTEEHAPINTILAISKQFPFLRFTLEYIHFKYEDERLASRGILKYQNGQILFKRGGVVFVKTCSHCKRTVCKKYINDTEAFD